MEIPGLLAHVKDNKTAAQETAWEKHSVSVPLAAEQRKQREAVERAQDVYRTYQANIKATNALQIALLKGMQNGEPLQNLFLKAMEALSYTTGNSLLRTEAEAAIAAIYAAEGIETRP